MRTHRIAAGGVILKNDEILLIRYSMPSGGSFLVGLGGRLESDENAIQAIVRETIEETGITVRPSKLLWIEDLQSSSLKICKIWMLL